MSCAKRLNMCDASTLFCQVRWSEIHHYRLSEHMNVFMSDLQEWKLYQSRTTIDRKNRLEMITKFDSVQSAQISWDTIMTCFALQYIFRLSSMNQTVHTLLVLSYLFSFKCMLISVWDLSLKNIRRIIKSHHFIHYHLS